MHEHFSIMTAFWVPLHSDTSHHATSCADLLVHVHARTPDQPSTIIIYNVPWDIDIETWSASSSLNDCGNLRLEACRGNCTSSAASGFHDQSTMWPFSAFSENGLATWYTNWLCGFSFTESWKRIGHMVHWLGILTRYFQSHQMRCTEKARVMASHPHTKTQCLLESWDIQLKQAHSTERRACCQDSTPLCWSDNGDQLV